MDRLSLDALVEATGGVVTTRGSTSEFTDAVIDGRKPTPGAVYLAISGERFDGHDFCRQAVSSGATGLVVTRGRSPAIAEVTTVEVQDTRIALGALARHVRRCSRARVIGITGSTGKTTTKELIAAALMGVTTPQAVLKTEGSLNNETGVPLTLLRLSRQHEFLVLEMGMRKPGDIDYLVNWAVPDVGVVVNAGLAHVGIMGSEDAIAAGKSQIWSRLDQGKAIYPEDDPRLRAHALAKLPRERHVTFGASPGADVRVTRYESLGAEGTRASFDIAGFGAISCPIPLVGRHNVTNAACALAVVRALELDPARAAQGLALARPAPLRGEITRIHDRNFLVDCYNANPQSMQAALETLADLAQGHGLAILGDMLELGPQEVDRHLAVGRRLAELGVDRLVAVGERARHYESGAREAGVLRVIAVGADDSELAAKVAREWTSPGDWILVKASRGMRLERVIEAFARSPA